MTTVRFAAFTLAATCLIALAITPNSPATFIIAGLFFACFGTVAWTCRDGRKRTWPNEK